MIDLGRLTADGEFKHYLYMQLPAGTVVPAEALNQNLLETSALGSNAGWGQQANAPEIEAAAVAVGAFRRRVPPRIPFSSSNCHLARIPYKSRVAIATGARRC